MIMRNTRVREAIIEYKMKEERGWEDTRLELLRVFIYKCLHIIEFLKVKVIEIITLITLESQGEWDMKVIRSLSI